MRFFVIGDAETVLGFSLVGIRGRVVATPDETREALSDAFRTEGLGIIILTERVAEPVRSEVNRYLYTTRFPLIIEIPDRLGPLKGRRSIRDMIRSAVGVHL
ncbi:MAG TPA: Vacuolar H+transporting two-sector ATPase F subunit [bacterium]|nr:Vacuolar H+transporting two-sector ATPase F subunit [bacterium]